MTPLQRNVCVVSTASEKSHDKSRSACNFPEVVAIPQRNDVPQGSSIGWRGALRRNLSHLFEQLVGVLIIVKGFQERASGLHRDVQNLVSIRITLSSRS